MSIHCKYGLVVLVFCFFTAEKSSCSFSGSIGTVPPIDSISSGILSSKIQEAVTSVGDRSSYTDPSSDHTLSIMPACRSRKTVMGYQLRVEFSEDDLSSNTHTSNLPVEEEGVVSLTSQNLQNFFNYKLYKKMQEYDQDARERAKDTIILSKTSHKDKALHNDIARAIAEFHSSQLFQDTANARQHKPIPYGCFSFLRK